MEPVGLSAQMLAKALHVPLASVQLVLQAKRGVSAEMTVLLSLYLGTSDSYWMNLQTHYDLQMAKERVGEHAARIVPHPHDKTGALRPVNS